MAKDTKGMWASISILVFLFPWSFIFSSWIIESRIFFFEEMYGYIAISVIGLIFTIISFYFEKERRKVYFVASSSIIPIMVSGLLMFQVIDDPSTHIITIFLAVLLITVLLILALYKLGVYSRYATDASVFGS